MIFAETSPGFYARGVPVIPLHVKDKRPIPLDWSRYHDHPVEDDQQKEWQRRYPTGNIGVVLGKQAGMVMLDIDTEDQRLIQAIRDALPPSQWERVGQKGLVMAYRWAGVRTFRIKNDRGESIVEHLSDRTQVVLPPSIHPKTQMPYVSNCDLLDVIDKLPTLPENVETILRETLKNEGVQLSVSGQSGVTDFVSRGSRDVTLTEKAGLFAWAVVKGERTLLEAIGMLRSFNAEFIEQVANDEAGDEKHVDNLLRFLRRDVLEKNRVLPEGWDEGLTKKQKEDWGVDFDKESEEWSYEAIIDHLKSKFEKHPEESEGRAQAVEYALARIVNSAGLGKLGEDRILQYIVDVGGLRLKISTLKQRLRELRQGEILGQDHSEIARAVLSDLEEIYTIRVNGSALWKYTGSHWEVIPDSEVLARVSRDFGHLAAAKRYSDHKGIYATMLNIAESGLKRGNSRGVNFANGFLTEELELVDHDKDHGMTYTLPFRYMPELSGKSFQFFDFLETCWGDDEDKMEKIAALQEALCVTLFGRGPEYQRVVLLKGVAKSGKSQLLEIAASLVPPEARSSVPPTDWADKFLPTQMHEKLINVCGELSEKKRIDGQRFKDIVVGTTIPGQMKGGQIFSFRPICTHWFASNHMPKTEDTSAGFNRRWLVLEFGRPVDPSKRRINVGEIIVAEEREAIVAWAVQAMTRLRENNEYSLPESHKQLIRELAQANNSVRFFMEASPKVCVGKTGGRISEHKLYSEYWSFCLGPGGAKPVGSRVFRGMMRELQHEMKISLVLERTAVGAQEAFYDGITIVDGAAA